MPADSPGMPGAERVNRFATAERGVAGPNTEFIDFFNETLMPGIEMSGGYGLFHPRRPTAGAHPRFRRVDLHHLAAGRPASSKAAATR